MQGINYKYNNKKTYIAGEKFDSKKESARFMELCMLQRSGVISDLRRQVRFEIVPKNGNERAAYYVADFVYKKADGKMIIEDVKSPMTKRLPLYVLKRKLVKYQYPEYIFIET